MEREEVLQLCSACQLPIFDRYIFSVIDRLWHERCLTCVLCGSPLSDRCYTRDGKLFCTADYCREFGPKCNGCGESLLPSDTVQKTDSCNYHVKCFLCVYCRRQLSSGDEYYSSKTGPSLICKADFQRLRNPTEACDDAELNPLPAFPHRNTPQTEDADEPEDSSFSPVADCARDCHSRSPNSRPPSSKDETTSPDRAIAEDQRSPGDCGESATLTGGKRRGPRTTIKAKQLETLKSAFAATPKPTRHIRERLAHETGLSMRVIQVWFQNRRSKERRLKQLTAMGARRGLFRNGRRLRTLRLLPDDLDLPLGCAVEALSNPLHPSFYPLYSEVESGRHSILGNNGSNLSLRNMAEYLAVAGDSTRDFTSRASPNSQDLQFPYFSAPGDSLPPVETKMNDLCCLADSRMGHLHTEMTQSW